MDEVFGGKEEGDGGSGLVKYATRDRWPKVIWLPSSHLAHQKPNVFSFLKDFVRHVLKHLSNKRDRIYQHIDSMGNWVIMN